MFNHPCQFQSLLKRQRNIYCSLHPSDAFSRKLCGRTAASAQCKLGKLSVILKQVHPWYIICPGHIRVMWLSLSFRIITTLTLKIVWKVQMSFAIDREVVQQLDHSLQCNKCIRE